MPEQQIPERFNGINYYLGIEKHPVEKEWVLACIGHSRSRDLVGRLLVDFADPEGFELIEADALRFSQHKKVLQFSLLPGTVVVLTSFILYQMNNSTRKRLVQEIQNFVARVNGYWINQYFDDVRKSFHVQCAGQKLIDLNNDSCFSWNWRKGVKKRGPY